MTAGSRLPAGPIGIHPGPLMWPGCTTLARTRSWPMRYRSIGELVHAVLAVGVLGRVLRRRDERAGPVGPDAAGVDHVLTVQRLDELPGLGGREARQVHDRIRPQVGDDRAEPAVALGRLPVTGHHLDVAPERVLAVGPARSPTDDDGLVPSPTRLGTR